MADTDRGILTEGAPLESYAYGEQSRGVHYHKTFYINNLFRTVVSYSVCY
jgi:hypothetical protein